MRRAKELHAEWTKLRTTPSTAWLPLAAVVMTVGLSTAITAEAAPGTISCADCDPARLSLSGIYLGQMAIVVLAVLAATGEYSSGLIITTLTATPRRLVVFAAKAAAVTTVVLPAGLVSVTASLAVGRILLPANGFTAANGYPALSLTHGPVLRAAVGTVLYLDLVALLSLGIAIMLRHTAAALTTVLGLLYLVPILAQMVTNDRWHTWIERYAPMSAGLAVQTTTALGRPSIHPWVGLGVLAAYAGTALILGAAVFNTRDA